MTTAVESYAEFFREAAATERARAARARSHDAKQKALAAEIILAAAAESTPYLDGTWRVSVSISLDVVLGLAEATLGREAPSVERTKKSA